MDVTSYTPGTPSWTDLATTDLGGAVAFYTSLFGWDAEDQGEESGHYTMCRLDGKSVAGLGPRQEGDPSPPAWGTYISVSDADATARAIVAAGGTVMAEPFDVMDAGRMAVCVDTAGGFFSIWQPGDHIGAEKVNEPNTLCWNELTVREADKALAFYTQVFGWEIVEQRGDDGAVTYREIHVGGAGVGGCIEMNESWPPELPTHWMTYFAVTDTDAACTRVTELGGSVPVPPFDLPVGRTAVVNDPQGAAFSVITMNEA